MIDTNQRQLGRGMGLFDFHVLIISQSASEGSQGRSYTGTWRPKLNQSPWRNAADWLAQPLLTPPRTTCLGAALPTVTEPSLTNHSVKEMIHRCVQQASPTEAEATPQHESPLPEGLASVPS